MKIKINHNAKEEAARIFKFAGRFEREIMGSIEEVFDIATLRIQENQIIKGGSQPRKNGGLYYRQVPGATVQRQRKWKSYGAPVFHKSKVVSRSGDFAGIFRKGSSELYKNIRKRANNFVGEYGVQGKNAGNIAMHETGSRGRKRRAPMKKGLMWAAKRFQTILVKKTPKLEKDFAG